MKERSTRNVLKRLKRIEDVLNPAPLYNTITPELQEMYDRILGKGKAAEKMSDSLSEGICNTHPEGQKRNTPPTGP